MWGFLFKLVLVGSIVGGIYYAVSRYFEHKGAAPYIAAHAKTVQDAKADTGAMQAASTRIGAETAAQTAQTTDAVSTAIKDLHHEYAKSAGAPVFDLGSLSAPLNDLVDRAWRAADTADAARRTGNAGAP